MSFRIRSLVVGSVVVSGLVGLDRAQAQCATWTSDFSLAGTDDSVDALCVFDDGTGSALYVGGRFTNAGGIPSWHIAKWTGDHWSPVGGGVGVGAPFERVAALTVFDDGSGPALIAAGLFHTAGAAAAHSVAKWNGTSWSPLGSTFDNAVVTSLAVFDDGNGPALYAGAIVNNQTGVYKWRGPSWSLVGTCTLAWGIPSMRAFDDGTGSALYVCGQFEAIGGVTAHSAARWNGTTWAPVGVVQGERVRSFAQLDDAGGKHLYAVGTFSLAHTVPQRSFAKWDGTSWQPLGPETSVGSMDSMTEFDNGHGSVLIGTFFSADWTRADIVRWDGTDLRFLNADIWGWPTTYATFDDGHGRALYMGGVFSAGGVDVDNIIRWNGASWSALGSSAGGGGVNGLEVDALAVYDDGVAPALYAGGWYVAGAPGVKSWGVVRWNGSRWSPVGNIPMFDVHALMAFDDGSGSKLYAGGDNVARWDGSSWSIVGSGVEGGLPGPAGGDGIQAFAVYDDGTGPALYAGGTFYMADWPQGGLTQIAKWDGTTWSRILESFSTSPVLCMQVFDDGTGPALYAAAGDNYLGSGPYFGKWDGHHWSQVGAHDVSGIRAMTVFDDGSGKALLVGGHIYSFFGQGGVLSWNGKSWSHVGQPSAFVDVVNSLTVYNDGTGPALYAGGWFASDDQTSFAIGNIAKLAHGSWLPIGEGLNAPVHAMTVFKSGTNEDLYVGGEFTTAGRYDSRRIARLHGCW
jgi:hypothetical protein